MTAECARVFVIGLDGAMVRAVRQAKTPNIDALVAEGVVTYAARSVVPSASYEAWGAMFHGVGPEKHRIDGEHPIAEDVAWPSFMKVIKQARPETSCAAFSCWTPINERVIEASIGFHSVSLPDPELALAAADYIRESPPDVYFMQLDLIDAAGHRHGYGTDGYLEQIATTDSEVGLVIDAIKDAGVFDESLIILLSDHGGEEKTHGSDHVDCIEIVWACRGPGVRQGVELETEVNIADTAPVVLRALGLPAPAGWDATVPDGIFAD